MKKVRTIVKFSNDDNTITDKENGVTIDLDHAFGTWPQWKRRREIKNHLCKHHNIVAKTEGQEEVNV